MKLLANELVKVKHSKAIRGVFIAFMCLMVLVLALGTNSSSIERFGFSAPFIWIMYNGASGFFLYGLVAAGMIASEFEMGVVHNAVSSGTKRGSYFAAKMGAVFGVSVLIYVSCTCIFTVAWSIRNGFDPERQIVANYILKVFTYNAGMCMMIMSYVAIFSFFAYLFRMAALTFIVSVVSTIADLMGLFRGPMSIALDTVRAFHNDAILSWDFAKLLLPCIWIIIISLALSYGLFVIRDVQ